MLQCSILYIRGHVEVYDMAGRFCSLPIPARRRCRRCERRRKGNGDDAEF